MNKTASADKPRKKSGWGKRQTIRLGSYAHPPLIFIFARRIHYDSRNLRCHVLADFNNRKRAHVTEEKHRIYYNKPSWMLQIVDKRFSKIWSKGSNVRGLKKSDSYYVLNVWGRKFAKREMYIRSVSKLLHSSYALSEKREYLDHILERHFIP